jgi:hypothetical protein
MPLGNAIRILGFIGIALAGMAQLQAQERQAYEGVVSWKKQPIGTVILLNIRPEGVSGSMRLEKFVPIEGGSVVPDGVEFHSAGGTYRIDKRRGKVIYSGPQGEGDRLVEPLTKLTGRLEELLEETEEEPRVATLEVNGRRRNLYYGRPTLWKNSGPPFETFERLDELLGKEISVWVADANLRGGRIVAIEEPADMNIPLKAPKKPKEPEKK